MALSLDQAPPGRWSHVATGVLVAGLLATSATSATTAAVVPTAVTAAASPSATSDPVSHERPPCWVPPVAAPVIDPFRRPACRWCPGNRGVKYGSGSGAPVRAVASGIVTFSGRVAGTGYVVVRHVDGIRATYGGITEPFRPEGSFVAVGATIGTTEDNLHFGLRDHDDYLDPTPHLGRLVLQARLVPLDGAPARPGRVRLVCPRSRGGARSRSR